MMAQLPTTAATMAAAATHGTRASSGARASLVATRNASEISASTSRGSRSLASAEASAAPVSHKRRHVDSVSMPTLATPAPVPRQARRRVESATAEADPPPARAAHRQPGQRSALQGARAAPARAAPARAATARAPTARAPTARASVARAPAARATARMSAGAGRALAAPPPTEQDASGPRRRRVAARMTVTRHDDDEVQFVRAVPPPAVPPPSLGWPLIPVPIYAHAHGHENAVNVHDSDSELESDFDPDEEDDDEDDEDALMFDSDDMFDSDEEGDGLDDDTRMELMDVMRHVHGTLDPHLEDSLIRVVWHNAALAATDANHISHGVPQRILEDVTMLQTLTEESAAVLNGGRGCCAICMEDYVASVEIRRLPCLCVFHKSCVDRHFHENFNCPVCRMSLTKAVRETERL